MDNITCATNYTMSFIRNFKINLKNQQKSESFFTLNRIKYEIS